MATRWDKLSTWDRLLSNVNKCGPRKSHMPTRCWVWTGAVRGRYGQMKVRGRTLRVHRVAYAECKDGIPNGLHVDHLCRTTLCVRPSHLEAVTQKENNERTYERECQKGHQWTDDSTYVRSDGTRECRICRRETERRRYARRSTT
ncbi:HNH endonuclease [Gordonia phage GMA6]|uniref:HNH nuclease domain-containing protein n=1 Tax=Gordonia phage GMA6 TaxID=1647285 RepID=A0A0K0NKU8_9CAUD|nr:HNH endonuclease [Gordonia phage GMA6]AKL88360.1 hypothetical protein GMA6_79 [Gordonia phage GMA6]